MEDYTNNYYDPKRQQLRQMAEQDYANASQANQRTTDQYLGDMRAVYDQVANDLRHGTEQQLQKLPQDYQYAYDKNEIQQLINERQVADRMSQLGLTDSGLNRTQQTAINLQRSNADQAVTQQKNAQINALQTALAEQLAKNRQGQLTAEAQARYDLANRNQNLYTSLMQNADSMAGTLAANQYNADQQRAAAEYEAAVKAEQTRQSNLLKQYELGLKYGTAGGMNNSDVSKLAMQMAENDAANGKVSGNIYDAYISNYNALTGSKGYDAAAAQAKQMLNNIPIVESVSGDNPMASITNAAVAAVKNSETRKQTVQKITNYLSEQADSGHITAQEAIQIAQALQLYS